MVDQVSLGSLGSTGLSALSVVGFGGIVDITWLNSGNIEAGSESRCVVVWAVEQVVEGGGLQVLMFLVNLGEDDWGHASGLLEGGSLGLGLVRNLGEGSSEL